MTLGAAAACSSEHIVTSMGPHNRPKGRLAEGQFAALLQIMGVIQGNRGQLPSALPPNLRSNQRIAASSAKKRGFARRMSSYVVAAKARMYVYTCAVRRTACVYMRPWSPKGWVEVDNTRESPLNYHQQTRIFALWGRIFSNIVGNHPRLSWIFLQGPRGERE